MPTNTKWRGTGMDTDHISTNYPIKPDTSGTTYLDVSCTHTTMGHLWRQTKAFTLKKFSGNSTTQHLMLTQDIYKKKELEFNPKSLSLDHPQKNIDTEHHYLTFTQSSSLFSPSEHKCSNNPKGGEKPPKV